LIQKNLRTLNDIDDLTAALRTELDGTGYESEKSVIFASSDTSTRVEVGSTLANQDFPGLHNLATEALNAKVLGVRVASVTSGRRSLFMCHFEFSFDYLMLVTLTRVRS
jgi:hypothetical protein